MILAVIGSRTPSQESVKELIDILDYNRDEIERIVTGGAYGADTVGIQYALHHEIPLTVYCPNGYFNKPLCQLAKDKGYDVRYTDLGFNERNTLIINDCEEVICPDYGNGTVDALWKAVNQGKKVFTCGKYIQGRYPKRIPTNIIQI